MTLNGIDRRARVERIEWARLPGRRPRNVGKNARLSEDHGKDVAPQFARITIDGATGFGWCGVSREAAERAIGSSISDLLDDADRLRPAYRSIEYPILDWLGRALSKPVFELIAPSTLPNRPLRVPCYDTSLYFDELGRANSDAEAVKILQSEAAEGLARGHRAFKMKVGRGARHMPIMDGLRRDTAVVNGVREKIGSDAVLLADGNNGFNANLAIEFLRGTMESNLYFLEEPFFEDLPPYQVLRAWMRDNGCKTLIADGEPEESHHLMRWVKDGVIDVLQYDVISPGFTRWLELADEINPLNIRAAPHHFGAIFGNYATCHLAPALRRFEMVEWDEATIDGLDASGYRIADGKVSVPDRPGFGLELDDRFFAERVKAGGWTVGV